MKKLFLLLLVFGSALAGCSNSSGMASDPAERNQRLSAISDINERQLVDDWDEFWLYDQNLKLTEWKVFVGD